MLPIRHEGSAVERPAVPAAKPPEPSLHGQVAALLRHRLVIAVCIVAATAAGIGFTMYSRPVYEAASVLRFEVEQVDLPQLVQMVASDNLIRTEIEVLGGRTVGAALVDSLGLRARLVAPRLARKADLFSALEVPAAADSGTFVFRHQGDSGFTIALGDTGSVIRSVRVGERITVSGITLALAPAAAGLPGFTLRIDTSEDAVARLQDNLKVSRPARDADLISIRTRANDPNEAAAMANFLATNLIARRQAVRRGRTSVAAGFLREQADSLGRQLRAAEDSLRAYQEREHVVDVPEQARSQVARLAGLQTDLSVIRADRDAFSALITQVRRDTAAVPDGGQALSRRMMAFPALLQNQSASVLLGALAVVENERAALLVRRLPTDRDVQILTGRIREIESQLQHIAESYLQSISNQVAMRESEASRFGTELDRLPEKELQTARREREAKILNDLWVLVQTRLKEAEITGSAGDPTVRLVDAAVAPSLPIRPRPFVNLVVSLVLGALIGVTVALARELGDRSVRSRADAHAAAGLPVLGAFPKVRQARIAALPWRGRPVRGAAGSLLHGGNVSVKIPVDPKRDRRVAGIESRLVTHPKASGGYREGFNQLFANLALAYRQDPLKVVVFTSALPGEGKTLSAVNFALTGASRGLRVLLIDADLRCGVIGTVLTCGAGPGFSELLAGTVPLDAVLRPVPVGEHGSLTVIPAGAVPKVPGRVLTVDRITDVLGALAPRFDVVVIDTPPVNLLADAALLGSAADGVLVVVRAGRTPSQALRYAMDQLEGMQAPVLGLLLNDIDLQRNETDDDSYRYLAEAERYHAVAP